MLVQSRTVRRRLVSLLAGACSSGEYREPVVADDATTAENPDAIGEAADTTESEPPGDDVEVGPSGLEGAIGEASDLVLSWFNAEPLDEATYAVAFDDAFRRAVSYEQVTPVLDQLRLGGPFEVRQVERSTATEADLLIVGAGGERARLSVAVATPNDPTMTGLFIGPAVEPSFAAPESLPDAVDRLQSLGVTRLGALDDGCLAIDESLNLAADEQAPIGSGFKLWVLAAVVEAVDRRAITWDEGIQIRDELDSIPSGITQNDQPGTTVSVRELAERMIEISDNTATDHLIDLVGRESVEDALRSTAHSAPDRNRPFLTTREFTIVKFSGDETRARYLAADETERRRILAVDVAAMPLPPLSNITTVTDPVDVETLEWFASPVDLCRVLTTLAENDDAAAILARNPGIPDRAGRWDSILYKGGSEPGVFAMAWLVTDADGNRWVIAGSIANETALIDEFEAAGLLGYVRDAIDQALR